MELRPLEKATNSVVDGLLGALGGFAQAVFELGEEHLDRVQVGRVLGQEEELGGDCSQGIADRTTPVGAEIVHDDDHRRVAARNSRRRWRGVRRFTSPQAENLGPPVSLSLPCKPKGSARQELTP